MKLIYNFINPQNASITDNPQLLTSQSSLGKWILNIKNSNQHIWLKLLWNNNGKKKQLCMKIKWLLFTKWQKQKGQNLNGYKTVVISLWKKESWEGNFMCCQPG